MGCVSHWHRLTLELALFSSAPQSLNVTVVTALSAGRLHMLEGMCTSWQGPLSAAVYQGVHEGSEPAAMEEVKSAVQNLFQMYVAA